MKITRRAKIKIRIREPVQSGNSEIDANCPLCGSRIQPARPQSGTDKNAETAKQILRETENIETL